MTSSSSTAALDASLAERIRATALIGGRFRLRSGAVADTYFDKYRFEAEPQLLATIAAEMAKMLPADTQVVAGLELGGIPLVTALSLHTGLPAAFLRKEPKAYGTENYAEGTPLGGCRVVLIEDIVSSGGALVHQIERLRADGIEPSSALCVIDRETGATENLARQNVPLKSLFRMSDLLD